MIKNIIFDIGNVLVTVDLVKFRNSIINEGVDEKKFDKFMHSKIFRKAIIDYETGRINTNEFVDFCLIRCGNKLNKKSFIKHFNGMLIRRPQMERFVKNLSKNDDYKLLLLSNTNPLHWKDWKENSPFVAYFDNHAISYKVGLYKPDIRFYKHVLKKYNFNPAETLYIDDREDNCNAAESLGINVIHYKNFDGFKSSFHKKLNDRKLHKEVIVSSPPA